MSRNKRLLPFVFVAVLIVGIAAVFGVRQRLQPTPALPRPTREELRQAVALGAEYLVHATKPDGEYVYLDHLDPKVSEPFVYNELRHAGALYPLGEYSVRYHRDPKVVAAMVRAAKFYVRKYVAPVPDTNGKIMPDVLGSWTVPQDEGLTGNREIKLGGVGLGLVGLVETERVSKGTTSLQTLRGLGNCLAFLQETDGSFYSKYDPKKGGKQDRWNSMYYPGEAALGLGLLYEFDPDPKQKTRWLNMAFRALGYLAKSRAHDSNLESDHWTLIAIGKLWPHYPASDQAVPRNLILEHAVKLSRYILDDPNLHSPRTTPAATRLEGLLAIHDVLPNEQDAMRREIEAVAEQEIARLIASQVKSGELKGAIPRDFFATPPAPGESAMNNGEIDRAGEIRIDYIQHAISAMMAYDHLLNIQSQNANSD
jgi:hypothetical protein